MNPVAPHGFLNIEDQASERAAHAAKLHDANRARYSVTINKSPEEIFHFFRDFENLPQFMKDLEHVQVLSESRSHWVMHYNHAANKHIEWDAQIIAERFPEMISWQSVGDSDILQAGSIWLHPAPAGRGTVVRLAMNYTVPHGRFSEFAAKFAGEDSANVILTNLRRLKALLETGEIPTTQGQPSGAEEVPVPIITH